MDKIDDVSHIISGMKMKCRNQNDGKYLGYCWQR